MSTTIAKANPKVGFVSLGCPNEISTIQMIPVLLGSFPS
ncbi:Ribosomal protein S12p Asp88 methylthiotransferase [Pseudomonas sp. R1-43-08]|nr:Ribosomal protein S12p Asp88 methylthiotransferase [Pseudomonas sp. R1-43-08]